MTHTSCPLTVQHPPDLTYVPTPATTCDQFYVSVMNGIQQCLTWPSDVNNVLHTMSVNNRSLAFRLL